MNIPDRTAALLIRMCTAKVAFHMDQGEAHDAAARLAYAAGQRESGDAHHEQAVAHWRMAERGRAALKEYQAQKEDEQP